MINHTVVQYFKVTVFGTEDMGFTEIRRDVGNTWEEDMLKIIFWKRNSN
jgi:hypothetical protein